MASIGKVVLELPPKPGNPRNSEGDFIRLKDGRIMFTYSKFFGSGEDGQGAEDFAPANIVYRTSSDNGDSFEDTDTRIFHQDDYNAKNIMSVTLMRMQDGALGLFFGVRYDWDDTRPWLSLSYDEGKTFSRARCAIPAHGYYVVNNDRIIRTSTGRILIPANFHRCKSDSEESYEAFDHRGIGYFFYSDDDGRTFKEARTSCTSPNPLSTSGLQETGVIELKGGVLWAYFRTDMGCQYQSYSFDDGDTWSIPQASFFTGPCSPLCTKRLVDGRIIAVWNPIPEYQTRDVPRRYSWGRTPLVAALSSDEGKSWSKPVMVEDGSDKGAYAYTTIFPLEDSVLLAYTAGNPSDKDSLSRQRVKKIMLSELEG